MQNFSPFNNAWKLCTYSRATPPPCSFPSPCIKTWKSKDKRRFREFKGGCKGSLTGADHLLHTSPKTAVFDSNESSEATNKDGKNGFSRTNGDKETSKNEGQNKYTEGRGGRGKIGMAHSEGDFGKKLRGSKDKTRRKRPYTANNINAKYKAMNDAESYCGSGGLNKSDASTSTANNMNDKGTFSTEPDAFTSMTKIMNDAATLQGLKKLPENMSMQQYNQLMQNTSYNNRMLNNNDYQALYRNNLQMQNNTAFGITNPRYIPNFMGNETVGQYKNYTDFCRQNCVSSCADFGTTCTNRTEFIRHACLSAGPDFGTNSANISLCTRNRCCDCGQLNDNPVSSNILHLRYP